LYIATQLFAAGKPDNEVLVNIFCITVPLMLLFYTLTAYVPPYYFKKGRYTVAVFLILLSVSVSIIFRFALSMALLNRDFSNLTEPEVLPPFWTQLRSGLFVEANTF
jgi:glucan phosphoethanolaminetransferase (alkaline phosphatase superfamily)